MEDGLIGFRVLQDNIQIIAKDYSKGRKKYKRLDQMFLYLFRLEILCIPLKKADMLLVFKIVRVYLFS